MFRGFGENVQHVAHLGMELFVPRRRLIPERTLTPTERSRRHRLRLRGVEPPAAPGRPEQPDFGVPTFEQLIEMTFPGCILPTWPAEPTA
jgi:hypothetical protein